MVVKHDVVKKEIHDAKRVIDDFVHLPDYPFDARTLWGDLRELLEQEQGRPTALKELSKLIGKAKSTVHFWFHVYDHPQLIAFMSLLERLSPAKRSAFIEARCRAFPTLTDPKLAACKAELDQLLRQRKGMTILTGLDRWTCWFVFAALGHSARGIKNTAIAPVGIDLHRPTFIVPVPTIHYLDPRLDRCHIQRLVRTVWPRILTARARLFLFGNVWGLQPSLRGDLLRLSEHRHVVIAEDVAPPADELSGCTIVRWFTVSTKGSQVILRRSN